MSQKGNNKYFDGSIVVNDSVSTRHIVTDNINGVPAKKYLTSNDMNNANVVKEFKEEDGGLTWKGVQLVPPNSVQSDRPYTEDEISDLITSLWNDPNETETTNNSSD